ncbi:La-related protein 6B [Linum perenne]
MALAATAANSTKTAAAAAIILRGSNRFPPFTPRSSPPPNAVSCALSRFRFRPLTTSSRAFLSISREIPPFVSFCTSTEAASMNTSSPDNATAADGGQNLKKEETEGGGGGGGGGIRDAANLLDLRVGKIIKAWRHEEADSLYVEEVDVGEAEPRIICSGLVKYIPLEHLEERKVVVLANLKPRNMRGVKSNGMLMAASDAAHENVELLEPPEGSIPGERIWFGTEDEKDAQPDPASPNQVQKKKIWEGVQPHLKTNNSGVAMLEEHEMRTSSGVVVEYYFSDLNLATTDHLMRFINKDPDGYVPLTVVASFKKVKAVVNSNAHLASILKNSSKLIVSEDGKKVKRQQPFTEQDVEELQSRIIVAENLPEDHCHQNLMKIFSSVGSVKTIRTCPPQNPGSGPSSVSRSTKADGMHFTNKLHAFVEYESVEIAEKAVMELNDEANWRNGLRVRLMLKRSVCPSKGARGKKGNDGAEEEEVSTSEQPNEKPVDDIPRQQHDVHAEETHTEKEGVQRKGRGRGGRGKGRGRGHPHHNSGRGNHLVGNPSSANNSTAATPEPSTVKQAPPPGPRMPDGTRGFAMGRGKPVPATAA